MEDSKRLFLERGQSINLSIDPGGKDEQEFVVQSVSGEGGASVCYDAIRIRDGLPGILKEFYPVDAVSGEGYDSLERLPDGQLIPKGDAVHRFREMCEDYLSTYAALKKAMEDNPRNQVLQNYIQNSEVLYGIAPQTDAAASVYIWSPGIMGQGFDEYLADARANPSRDANFKLRDILSTVYTITDCIGALHASGWMHLDVKPSGFTVPFDRKNGINTNGISLFDVNKLYPVDSDVPRMAGKDGFQAPDVFEGRAGKRSDIYSIGAMLFHALVILADIPDGIYRDDYYPDIDRMIRHSALIKNSTAGTMLVSLIANIIKKCLAGDPNDRYDSCAGLLDALENAVSQARSNAGSPKAIGRNKKAAAVDVNEKGINSPGIVIQKMLYDHPLYEALAPGQTQINVLVIGSGTYGQKFIDLCLQAGQMKGYDLHITAVSSTPEEDMQAYLQFRPALSRFVNVNGSMEGNSRAYGTVRFISLNEACRSAQTKILQFERGRNKSENECLVQEIIKNSVDRHKTYDYIFIALGSSTLNGEIARQFEKETLNRGKHTQCPVCYISELAKKKRRTGQASMIYPVHVNEPITPETISPLLEQMAFNTDIAWNSSLNIDVRATFEKFRKNEYRYGSSLAYVLSIPYKLFSIGIVIQNQLKPFAQDRFPDFVLANDVSEAADVFAAEVLAKKNTDPEAKSKFDTLVCLEHQRWVLNRVCESWTAPLDENGQLDLERCVAEGKVKNESRQTHPCIVFSTEATPLSSPAYKENGHQKWNDPDIDPDLDELDRMSVALHQRFRAKAEAFKAGNPMQGEDILAIDTRICGENESVIRAYKQFLFCLKNILNGVESYTRQFDYYRGCFTDELSKLPDDMQRDITGRLDRISKDFYPVMEANKYRNYKATDETLVEKIPFILTYHFQDTLALAFEDGKHQNGRNEAVFSNVAAATVLCPERILYLYNYTVDTKPDLLINKLSAVLNYLGKRKVHCKVSLAIAFPADIVDSRRDKLKKRLDQFKAEKQTDANASFAGYEILDCMDSAEAISGFLQYMEENNASFYDGSTAVFDSALDQIAFLNQLLQTHLPYFEFDWRHKRFTKHESCDYLQYIHDNSSIRINDMFALMNAEDTRFNLPEFAEDYTTLWDIYSGNGTNTSFEDSVGNWNMLCKLLGDYESKKELLATIQLNKKADAKKKTLTYVLPEYTYKTVSSIVRKLIGYGVIDSESSVVGYTSENCKVQITTKAGYAEQFDKLFEKPELLLSYYGVDAVKRVEDGHNEIRFVHRNMQVSDLDLAQDGKKCVKALFELLEKLEAHHYIRLLKREGNLVSFEYAAPRIRKLLTSAGEILEIYTYYQLLNTGYFDDVACGYEFRWQYDDVKNELDIVATKGFRSIIVECKAVKKLELDYYHKLHSIAEQFGIGTIKVLVGNTYRKKNDALTATNKMQQSRGSQLSIITFSDKGKIVNIGQTLKELME